MQLNPNFRYLRATSDGRVILLVLGYVDSHPHGPIQVWYSAQREVLRIQNGRIVGAVGLNAEWRDVVLPELPSWSRLAQVEGVFRWVRVRDFMPGYRFGVRDTLALRVVNAPPRSALQDMDPLSLTWFEEALEFDTQDGSTEPETKLVPARYAVTLRGGTETVVYGEQCLSSALCITWQTWPATPQSAKAAR